MPNKIILYNVDMSAEETSIIQSVDRAMILLKAVASNPQKGKTLNELTAFLGIDRSSIFRSLTTLIKHNLVRQDKATKCYKLGYGVFQLAGALRVQDKLTEVARPFLVKLVEKIGENAHLAVRSGNLSVFIDREQGNKTLTANTDLGGTEELYCTAVGRCLICNMNMEQLHELYSPGEFRAYTENTIISYEQLYEELCNVRETGFAVDNEEYEYNIICLAGPIYNFENKIEAAIGVSGPKLRIKNRIDEIGSYIKELSEELSALRGYQGI